MLSEVPDGDAIGKAVDRLLLRADAYNRWPTPIGDLIAAAGLVEPEHSMLSDFVLEQAPAHLQAAIRKLKSGGRLRALLDRKEREVHIDPTITQKGREAFHKLHEVSHDIYPWQKELAYADDDATFSPSIRKLFEWQANQGAAELLFQRGQFTAMARHYTIGMASIVELAGTVGASIHSTFRRFVEVRDSPVAGIVLDTSPRTRSPLSYTRHEVIFSTSWKERFGGIDGWPHVLCAQPYSFVKLADQARTSGQAVAGVLTWPDLRNEQVRLDVELLCNGFKTFALVCVPRRERLRKKRIIVPGPTRDKRALAAR